MSAFSVENPHDGKTFENYTRFEGGVEVGVVTTFMLWLFVPHEFDMINSAIDCSFNFDIVIFSFDLVCFCDAHWDFRTLFWDDTICLQHHRKFSFLWRSEADLETDKCARVLRDILRVTCSSPFVLSFCFLQGTVSCNCRWFWPITSVRALRVFVRIWQDWHGWRHFVTLPNER